MHLRCHVRGVCAQAKVASRARGYFLVVQRATRDAVNAFFRKGPKGQVRLNSNNGTDISWSVGEPAAGTPVVLLDLRPNSGNVTSHYGDGAGRGQLLSEEVRGCISWSWGLAAPSCYATAVCEM